MSAIKEHYHAQIEAAQRAKERPILFTSEMVCAILQDRKTQTRRLIKPQPRKIHGGWEYGKNYKYTAYSYANPANDVLYPYECPYGQPGDQLWVREKWLPCCWDAQEGMIKFMYADHSKSKWIQPYTDDHDGEKFNHLWLSITHELERKGITPGEDGMYNHISLSWRPSIHMPRAAARLHLQITHIRVERLHDITEEDAIAEGIGRTRPNNGPNYYYDNYHTGRWMEPNMLNNPIASYCTLWEKINGPGSWEQNPWVWAITFKKTAA